MENAVKLDSPEFWDKKDAKSVNGKGEIKPMPSRTDESPTSSMIASRGIKTASDFAQFMGALMEDLVEGRIDPDVANACCKAGDCMLRVVSMQIALNEKPDVKALNMAK